MRKPWSLFAVAALLAGCATPSASPTAQPTPPAATQRAAATAAVPSSAAITAPPAAEPTAAPPTAAPPTATRPAPTPTLAPSPTATPTRSDLPVLGAAPELQTDNWINSAPLTMAGLRGRVVLVDIWTFMCINCRHVIPSLRDLHQRYGAQGLTVIGVHSPEFQYEHDLGNLQRAVKELDVPYAVTQDNGWVTWKEYGIIAWPTVYAVDKQGQIRYRHVGEWGEQELETVVQALLAEPT